MAEKFKPLDKPWAFLDEYRGKVFSGEWPTLPEMFSITASRHGERNCFTEFNPGRNTLTYNQVKANIIQLSQWMLENGIKKGDRIAVTGKNSPEWATVFFAAGFAGAIIVPIDHGLHEIEVANLLKASEPKMFFIDEEKYPYFNNPDNGFKDKMLILSINKKNPENYVYNLKASGSYTAEMPKEEDTAAILFTSGTTGNPKGVMLSHKNLVSDTYIAQTRLLVLPTDVFYALLPIHHAYTMQAVLIESMSVGCEVVFGKSMAVTKMLKELKDGKITMLLGVPLLFNKLLAGILKGLREKGIIVYGLIRGLMGVSYLIKKIFGVNPGKKMFGFILKKVSLENIRICISGGGPLASSVFRIFNELGIDFIQGYGLTETSPIIALNPKEKFKIESVGQYFFPYCEMKIIDADENGIGEVVTKGPMNMQGYYKMPEETAAMFTEDGFLKTGDLGKLDSEGYLILCGRAKNLIVTDGGKNVFPEEIENAFQLYSDIEQITIQGYIIDESTKSEGIEALVYPSDDLFKRINRSRDTEEGQDQMHAEVEEIIAKVNKTLQPYARISKITYLEKPLEMTTSKKVKRVYNK